MSDEPVLPKHVYEQVADAIEAEIASGRIPVGGRLAGQYELAELHGVSRNSIRSAIELLHERGLVSTLRGRGTYVIRSRRLDPGHDETPPPDPH